RVLAALAHLAVALAPRLPVHPPRRSPQGNRRPVPQPDPHHAAWRAMAWRELDVHRMGLVSWRALGAAQSHSLAAVAGTAMGQTAVRGDDVLRLLHRPGLFPRPELRRRRHDA